MERFSYDLEMKTRERHSNNKRTEIERFDWFVAKTIFYSLAALVRKMLFCHSKIKFISSRHCVISSMYVVVRFYNISSFV